MKVRIVKRVFGVAFCVAIAVFGSAGAESMQTVVNQPALRIGNGAEPETLDPQRASGVSASNILRDLYEGLTGISPGGAVIAAAAQSWTVSDDGRDYVFVLRDHGRWSNGEALSAEDFVAGLRRCVDPATASGTSAMLAPIVNATAITARRLRPEALGVEAVDAQTLHIRLVAPAPYFLRVLSHPATFPVHRPSLARYGREFARAGRLVGNGAYRLAEWSLQAQIVLRRNTQYWNDAHTSIDTVVYVPTEDLNSELKRYRADELDVTGAIPTAQAPWIRAHLGSELHVATYLGSYYYGFNLSRPPFKDAPGLRQALSLAVDREVIAEKLLHGLGAPAYGWVPPGTAGYAPQQPAWAAWPRAQRLSEARRLYAAAGYSDAHPLEVEIRYNTQDDNKRIAVVIAAMWKQALGVQARLVNEEWKVFLQNRRRREVTEAFRSSWIGDYDDAGAFAEVLRSTHPRNDSAYVSARYDALLDEAAQSADEGERNERLEAAERVMLDDAPILPIYFYTSKHLVKPRVEGWQGNVLDYHYSKDLRLHAP